MQRDFGISFVTQCAPVMAGLKPANLFRWVKRPWEITRWPGRWSVRGVLGGHITAT